MSEDALRIGIIGAGRLGSCLAAGFSRHGYRVSALCQRDVTAARAMAGQVGAVAVEVPQGVADAADVVFVTTPDREIRRVTESVTFTAGQIVLHCSGATPLAALASAAASGARCGSFHPLQTFPVLLDADRLTGITFGVGADDEEVRMWLGGVAESFGSTTVDVPEDARALYHAAAVLVSPLTMGLMGLAAGLWEEWGASRDEAVRAMAPLAASTVAGLRAMPFPSAMTGPYARGDVEVIRAHLSALAGVEPEVGRAYATLALATLPIATQAGDLDDMCRGEILGLLNDFLKRSE